MSFKEANLNSLEKINPFDLVGNDWMLITSGTKEKFNTMTASWGTMGILWNKPVCMCFVRPQRYTFEFMEKNDYFSLCFFEDSFKSKLVFCGRNSGRDCDKIKETGLKAEFDLQTPYFQEAKLVLICKKIYNQFIDKDCILDKEIYKNYEQNDYHKMYIGEIVKCLVRD